MFRLLNFKWDGSHRVRPSCDNFRSKLVDPSCTQESESTGNTPDKPINTVQKSDQDDYELQVSQLEEFCAKMTQYQAHMKALEERNEFLAAQNAQFKEENFKLKAKRIQSTLPTSSSLDNNNIYTALNTVSLPSFPQQNPISSPNEAVI